MRSKGGGHGRGGRRGQRKRRGRGHGYQTGLCKDLGTNVFDFGTKGAADQMRKTWERICHYVGFEMGPDIAMELRNETRITIDAPTYTDEVQARHAQRELIVTTCKERLQNARRAMLEILEALPVDEQSHVAIATLKNEIAMTNFELLQPVPVELTDVEKILYDIEWEVYSDRMYKLKKHRGQAFFLVLGQCTQLLQDRMQQDPDWDEVNTSNDPLQLYQLIKKIVQGPTNDQYPPAIIYEQLVGLFGCRQENLSNAQWYERFNAATAVGVSFEHKVLLEYQAGLDYAGATYESLTDAQKQAVKQASQEQLLAYIMLRQSKAAQLP